MPEDGQRVISDRVDAMSHDNRCEFEAMDAALRQNKFRIKRAGIVRARLRNCRRVKPGASLENP